MRAFLFYPLIVLASAALIITSLGFSLTPIVSAPVQGRAVAGGLEFGLNDLARVDPGAEQLVFVSRTFNGGIDGVQIATRRVTALPSPTSRGARLVLAPEAARALAGKPLRVWIKYRPLVENSATQLALSAQGAGPGVWVSKTVSAAGETILQFDLPAPTDGQLSAIALWPQPQTSNTYYWNYGLEILAARVESAR